MTETGVTMDRAAHMEARLRKYFDGGHESRVEKVVVFFAPLRYVWLRGMWLATNRARYVKASKLLYEGVSVLSPTTYWINLDFSLSAT